VAFPAVDGVGLVIVAAAAGFDGSNMRKIPRRYGHYVFAVIQSGITTALTSGIASAPLFNGMDFLLHWLKTWLIAWAMIIPVAVVPAPLIRGFVNALTEADNSKPTSSREVLR
jgi:hypothetical protein